MKKMTQQKKRKIPNYVILVYKDDEIKHYIDSEDDLEAVIMIAEIDGYKIKYPNRKDWRETC